MALVAPNLMARLVASAEPLFDCYQEGTKGWQSWAIHLGQSSPESVSGFVQSRPTNAPVAGTLTSSTRVPFSLAGSRSTTLELPIQVDPRVESTAVDIFASDGRLLKTLTLDRNKPGDVLLYDLEPSGTLGAVLDGQRLVSVRDSPKAGVELHRLAVGTTAIDPQTTRPRLPALPGSYDRASCVFARSERLIALSQTELQALSLALLRGGCLAVVVTQLDHLASPVLTAWLGGPAHPDAVPVSLVEPESFVDAPSHARRPLSWRSLAPSPQVVADLRGYQGGNLHTSPFGACAAFGLGEVHLLAFDPSLPAASQDPWTQAKLLTLIRHARQRHRVLLTSNHRPWKSQGKSRDLLTALNPSPATDWAVGLGLVGVLACSLLIVPLGLRWLKRPEPPGRALRQLTAYAVMASLLVLLIGLATRVHATGSLLGRVERLTLLEVGAGMSHGAGLGWYGLTTTTERSLTLNATGPFSLLDVASPVETGSTLIIEPGTARLDVLSAAAGRPLLVAEESFVDLGGELVVQPIEDEYGLVSRLPYDLDAVLAWDPKRGTLHYFSKIEPRARLPLSQGRLLTRAPTPAPGTVGMLVVSNLQPFTGQRNRRLLRLWQALAETVGPAEWWPTDVPAILAARKLPRRSAHIAELPLGEDWILYRFLGLGGAP